MGNSSSEAWEIGNQNRNCETISIMKILAFVYHVNFATDYNKHEL